MDANDLVSFDSIEGDETVIQSLLSHGNLKSSAPRNWASFKGDSFFRNQFRASVLLTKPS